MKRIKIFVEELINFLSKDIVRIVGSTDDVFFDHLADSEHVDLTTLDWVKSENPSKQIIAENSRAQILLVDEEVVLSEKIKKDGKVLIVVKNPKMALAKVGNHYFVEKPIPGIHPTAIIDKDAVIGKNVSIGAYSVVGKAMIGDDCIIDSNVRIYDNVKMGQGCNIKSGAILGGAGFGFEKDKDGNRFRFPQIGSLIMGDDVEVAMT